MSMTNLTNETQAHLAQLYLGGLNVHEVSKASGISEHKVKATLNQLGVMRNQKEALALARKNNKEVVSRLEQLERQESAPCCMAHRLFKSSTMLTQGDH
ncbi:helix-turn-helix domain-containing protein [Shewanella sp. Isolate11]|uniref:helix-turn-helix domain-containing protein n=1 Tax=Shewanella sp. Isolate11 TaxID=2908530 RepID=UPI001EFD93AC|nr:helix-turn-helix domain-containing protein [Shewanella sp. Isolate11]MCG9697458.1 helix-turn-helix domain-containing protein [Shewanella sp. Isolate11]